MLVARQVSFAYPGGPPVLREVDLSIGPGRITGLFGPNGSGKSTLVRCLNGTLPAHSGTVTLDDEPLESMPPRRRATRVAVVPQTTPATTGLGVQEMVMLGRYPHGNLWGDVSAEDTEVVHQSLARVGAGELTDRPFNQLSGGQQQRVVVARALAQQARVLLLDEPANHLDVAAQLELYELLRHLADEGYAVLVVTHDILLAPTFIDEATLLHRGRLVASGPVASVLTPENVHAAFGRRIDITWTPPHHVEATLR
ncbi:MAG: ABC transporter ATP-binding protein [Planctomycetota bacterium]